MAVYRFLMPVMAMMQTEAPTEDAALRIIHTDLAGPLYMQDPNVTLTQVVYVSQAHLPAVGNPPPADPVEAAANQNREGDQK